MRPLSAIAKTSSDVPMNTVAVMSGLSQPSGAHCLGKSSSSRDRM